MQLFENWSNINIYFIVISVNNIIFPLKYFWEVTSQLKWFHLKNLNMLIKLQHYGHDVIATTVEMMHLKWAIANDV